MQTRPLTNGSLADRAVCFRSSSDRRGRWHARPEHSRRRAPDEKFLTNCAMLRGSRVRRPSSRRRFAGCSPPRESQFMLTPPWPCLVVMLSQETWSFPGAPDLWHCGSTMKLRKANERGHANHGWLNTFHTFSFAGYYDPEHMGFRSLRVINDDTVKPGAGFGMHPHRDMEIITYVLDGALEHKDSMGNGRVIRPGEFQYMAAGTGVQHSEFNPSDRQDVHLLQIWIQPDRKGVKPAYAERSFAAVESGRLHLVTSRSGRDGSMAINQDADLFLGRLAEGERVAHEFKPGRHAWLHVAEGRVRVNGQSLDAGDAVAFDDAGRVEVAGESDAQILLFDLN
jgi:redox-sensitive bicupin YhaK (pirin superfamily)